MQKTDLMELKKTLKKDKVTISRICTCYVCGQDKKMYTNYSSFLNLPDEEFYKYLEILKKLMSCKAGDTLQTLDLNDEECKKVLTSLRTSELRQEGVGNAFLEKIKDSCNEDNNYAIFLFYSAYDIPARGTDKLKQDESDEVYNAIYGVICPVELSEPGLSYFESNQEFHNRNRDAIVGSPFVGFMYPDYNNKEVNMDKIAYGVCNPKKPHNEIPSLLFGSYSNPTADQQAKILSETLAETLDNEDVKKVAKVTKNIIAKAATVREKIKEDKEMVTYDNESDSVNNSSDSEYEDNAETIISDSPAKISVINEPVASFEDIKETIIESGINEDKAEKVIESFKAKMPQKTDKIRVDKISKKGKIKCDDDIDISIPAEKLENVKVELRDGKKCVVIELSDVDSEVSVNGVICK